MKILMTGATGWIGRGLTEKLVTAGHEIHALSRTPEILADRLPFDAVRARSWDEPLPHVDAVIHLAGEPIADERWTDERKNDLIQSRVGTTARLLNEFKSSNHGMPKFFLSASAVGYYGDRGNEVLDESSPPGRGFAADLCVAWEAAALKAKDLGMEMTCARLGVVLGQGGGALEKMLPAFKAGLGARLGSGKQWMSWIHYEDAIRVLLWIFEKGGTYHTVNVVAPEPVTNTDFTVELGRALHRPAILKAPEFALRLGLGERASMLLDSERVIPGILQRAGFEFRFPTLRSALEDIIQGRLTSPS